MHIAIIVYLLLLGYVGMRVMNDDTPTTLKGLSQAEVERLTANGQSNLLPRIATRSIWQILRANLVTYFNMIVIGSCLLLFVFGQWRDALFGIAAIANVVIGVVQEYRAKRLLDRLVLTRSPQQVRVVRGGSVQTVAIQALVPGDLLLLRTGEQVPADAVVVQSTGLEVNESLLTGEVDPISKHHDDAILSGSVIVAGSAYASTSHVGADSFVSRMTSDAKRFSLVHSELRAAIARILRWISIAIIPIAGIVLNGQVQAAGGWSELGHHDIWLPVMVGLIASLVGMIPLGLVLLTSIAFAVGAVKLARHNVLIQELAAVEGLARADIVCFDKTGTLTEGRVVFDHAVPVSRRSPAVWRSVLGLFAAGSDVSATTKALLEAFPDTPDLAPSSTIPFSSSRQWSALAVERGRLKGSWMLGAPERLLDLSDPQYAQVASLVDETTRRGHRTLLLTHAPDAAAQLGKDAYRPVVVIILTETIRHDVAQTLAYFAEQGVGIRVFSGDNPQTVTAIAREAGIDVTGDGYDARQLPTRSSDLVRALEDYTVFGRVTPDQKKAMVRALQKAGHVVAMIGDGVNDTMAVKQADIGVAMGSGSEATRAVARLILLESDFTQFPRVIAEGRQVMANIERLALIFLTKTAYIMTLSIIFGLTLWGFPFLPRQLSAVDGLTIGIPAFFLALMPSTRRYMPGFIGRTLRRAVPLGLTTGSIVAGLALYLRVAGFYDQRVVQTSLVLALALLALWILVIFARPLNQWRLGIIAAMYVGLVGTFAIPLVRDFFMLTILPSGALIAVFIASAIGCTACELLVRSRGRWTMRIATAFGM